MLCFSSYRGEQMIKHDFDIFSLTFQADPCCLFISKYDPLVYKLSEIEDWLDANNISYSLTQREECTKHVFIPTEYSQNEYEITGWNLYIPDEKDLMHYKLVWGGNND